MQRYFIELFSPDKWKWFTYNNFQKTVIKTWKLTTVAHYLRPGDVLIHYLSKGHSLVMGYSTIKEIISISKKDSGYWVYLSVEPTKILQEGLPGRRVFEKTNAYKALRQTKDWTGLVNGSLREHTSIDGKIITDQVDRVFEANAAHIGMQRRLDLLSK